MAPPRPRQIGWPFILALALLTCASENDTAPVVDTGRGGQVVPTGGTDPPANVWRGGGQTVCRRTVPEDISPANDCSPDEIGSAYDGCSHANQPCGPVRGCLLERNERIASEADTSYGAPDEGFTPPRTALPAMGTPIEGLASAWFARGDGTAATGSCSLPPVRNIMAVAISQHDFGNADWCGACAEIVGRSGQRVRVQIVDQCAGCEHGAIDLAAGRYSPFSMLEASDPPNCPANRGRQPVTWHVVPCETQGGIVIHYPPGFNHCTPAVQVRNHRLPIVKLEDRINGEWATVERQPHNWYYVRSPGDCRPFEITLRITAIDGSTITGTFPPYEAGKSHEATSQF
jgi:expansin (peptidoglycan-binding protein)